MQLGNTTPETTTKKKRKVAVVGNPNAGKTSVFNCLTGLHHQVGNYPGVTVDRKTGTTTATDGCLLEITDLPGTYSLYPTSLDESIVFQTLCQPELPYYPDVLLYVADITHLERHLLLFSQVADLGIPIVLALTMSDVATKAGISCDVEKLSRELGIAVLTVNGRTGKGIEQLKNALAQKGAPLRRSFYAIAASYQPLIQEIQEAIGSCVSAYEALLVAHHTEKMPHLSPEKKKHIQHLKQKYAFNSVKAQVEETMQRYAVIEKVLEKVVKRYKTGHSSLTDKADSLLTHPFYGMLIFLTTLFFMFQALFAWAEYPMNRIEEAFAWLSEQVKAQLPTAWYTDLLSDGIIAGLGGIFVFVPQIALLFLFVSVLEEVGYMARAVFLTDKIMRKFGLNGRSVVALLSGMACAIPAILSTRTIPTWKERLITIMVTPLMSCSARIPVFTLLAAFVVSNEEKIWGIFNLQGIIIMAMYLAGASAALLAAFVMKKIVRTQETHLFVMELPPYRTPHWRNVVITVYEKVKTFVVEAGKVILIISVVLWGLSSFGPEKAMQEAEQNAQQLAHQQHLNEEQTQRLIASQKLEASYAGMMGKFIEPVIRPLGFDWKIGIALLTSFAAREVFVGTMSVIYSAGSEDDVHPLLDRMRLEIHPHEGKPVYTTATALSLLVYYVFAMQCMSTIAVVKRETKRWRWAFIQFAYMTLLAYLMSFLTFQLFQNIV